YEKELMALVLSIQHWRHYLLGRQFVVYTDHKSLKHFLKQRVTSPDQQCWLAKLLGYQFEVKYKAGLDNKAADALSRCHGELNVMVSSPKWLEGHKLLMEVSQDTNIQRMMTELIEKLESKPGFYVQQREKHSATTPGGLLQPLPIPNAVWEDLSIDFITGLPKSKGYEAVLVVVDRLSKYSHFILLKHPYNAKTIAELFVKEIVRLHGIPSSIISDRDPIFMSHFWMELFKLQGTNLKMSSAYHPETDGQTEMINMCLEGYLRCFASEQPKSWSHWLPWAEY
ncbi:hypothetical protein A2U01_0017078, partial [Trifolium medium]|nr:hypothetical protein [Trifolium medium]